MGKLAEKVETAVQKAVADLGLEEGDPAIEALRASLMSSFRDRSTAQEKRKVILSLIGVTVADEDIVAMLDGHLRLLETGAFTIDEIEVRDGTTP